MVDAFTENNWHPLRVSKQILVGTFSSFGVYDWGTESDWNIHIAPGPDFENLISTALERIYADTDEWMRTPDGRYTIEAEITRQRGGDGGGGHEPPPNGDDDYGGGGGGGGEDDNIPF